MMFGKALIFDFFENNESTRSKLWGIKP